MENKKAWTDLSIDERMQAIREDLSEYLNPQPAMGDMSGGEDYCWIMYVYDTYVIVCRDDDKFKLEYKVDDMGEVVPVGELQPVVMDWKPAKGFIYAGNSEDDRIKAGARNNKKDQANMQKIHDLAIENGASCPNAMKAISKTADELRIGNYIVLFGDTKARDLEGIGTSRKNTDGSIGEWFSPEVDVESEYTKSGVLHVDWEHGEDPEKLGNNKNNVLGYVDWKTAKRDPQGIFVERVLSRRNTYVQWLEGLIEDGLVGSSSLSADGVSKKSTGEITKWPLERDTLTVNPMEPRMLTANQLQAMKALKLFVDDAQPHQAAQASVDTPATEPARQTNVLPGVNSMEIDEAKLNELLATAAANGAQKALASLPAAHNPDVQVILDEADRPFTSLAENCKAIKVAETTKQRHIDPRLKRLMDTDEKDQKAVPQGAGEGTPSDGGYLLEPTLSTQFLAPMHDEGPFTRKVQTLPVGTNSNYGWLNGVDETSRANGSRWGGVLGVRLNEGGTGTPTKPKFRRINWELKKYAVFMWATDELLMDSAQFSKVANDSAGEELVFMANDDIMNGVGAGGPLGVMNAGSLIKVARVDASKIQHADILAMWQRMLPRFRAGAEWFVNSEAEPQLDALYFTGSTSVLSPYVTYGPDGVIRIKGRPVNVTEFNPALNAAGDILLGNFSQYLFWERQVQSASSIHVSFMTDETMFRFIYRCDGQPAHYSAITPFKGTNTQSAFVSLGAGSA